MVIIMPLSLEVEYYSPLTYIDKVLYPARRTSEVAVRACGSKS